MQVCRLKWLLIIRLSVRLSAALDRHLESSFNCKGYELVHVLLAPRCRPCRQLAGCYVPQLGRPAAHVFKQLVEQLQRLGVRKPGGLLV